MPRYRLSFHLEFDTHDDVSARELATSARSIAYQLGAMREYLNGLTEHSGGKLQRLYADQPPRLLQWYDLDTAPAKTDEPLFSSADLSDLLHGGRDGSR